MIYIGIDPGKNTGLAVWDSTKNTFLEVATLKLHEALDKVRLWETACRADGSKLIVIFEDARQRTWIKKEMSISEQRGKLQGAGSIKRDCTIWEEFLSDTGVMFFAQPPRAGMTKMTDDYFRTITKWQCRTSNHARDAAMLVFGR